MLDKNTIELIIKGKNDGLTYMEIARKLNIKRSTVAYYLNKKTKKNI